MAERRLNLVFRAGAIFITFILSSVIGQADEPWRDGEQLRYEIHWGMFVAAEVNFTAKSQSHDDLPSWSFQLDLKSRGVVDSLYPMQSSFLSAQQSAPWRSVLFTAHRNENKREKKYRTEINYVSQEGSFENKTDQTSEQFAFEEAALDDLLSSLYTLRRHPWEEEKTCKLTLYEDRSLKQAEARLIELTNEKDENGRRHPCFLIEAREQGELEEGKRRVVSRIWITRDARRIPLRAECQVRFGTFRMTLKQKSI
ncbi:MAG: DUF3108 domain-containing protein [Verrucomicrobiota bacterium]